MQDKMEFIQKHVIRIISSMQEIVLIITSLFECVKKENNYMISDIKDLRKKTNVLISDLKINISTLEKKLTVKRRA